jgi:putative SOS response-associated peptidase YedK
MTLTEPDLSAVAALIEARLEPADAALYRPRFNAAPSDLHFIGLGGKGARRLVPARWGVAGTRRQLVINARSESADLRPMFRDAWARRRCVVPADGFYEWTGGRGDRRPLWFHLREAGPGGVFFFAGLFEEPPPGAGEARPSFCVLTAEANALVRPVHDRMPVILDGAQALRWLSRPDPALLAPAPEGLLVATEVSPRANSVANDDPGCLVPAPLREGQKQRQLPLL